jgi:hypothetical protein
MCVYLLLQIRTVEFLCVFWGVCPATRDRKKTKTTCETQISVREFLLSGGMPVTMSTPRASSTPRRSSTPRSTSPARNMGQAPWPYGTGESRIRRTTADVRKPGQPTNGVAFGTFEVGRSSMPRNAVATAVFKDGTVRGIVHSYIEGVARADIGDPGAYDPLKSMSIEGNMSFTHNKNPKPFNSGAPRDLNLAIYGRDSPGVQTYAAMEAAKKNYKYVDDNACVFTSGSLQRPSPANSFPGPEAYSPVMTSVYPNVSNGGASMRATCNRFRHMTHPDHLGGTQNMTDERIGPGAYDSHNHGSIHLRSQRQLMRMSKLRPGFGTVSPQRQLPHRKSITPGPGHYQPEIWIGPTLMARERTRRASSAPKARSRTPRTPKAEAPAGDTLPAAPPPAAPVA